MQIDGAGTMMACESSILNDNRNPGLTKKEAEEIFKFYYGVEQIIWLKGNPGIDVTDQHIDGLMSFVDENTILTMSREDLQYEELLSKEDINKIYQAVNIYG